MLNHTKACCIIVITLVVSFLAAGSIYFSTLYKKSLLKAVHDTVTAESKSLEHEIELLYDIQTKLNRCDDCSIVSENIAKRISQLRQQEDTVGTTSRIRESYPKYLKNGQRWWYERIRNQTEFLMGLHQTVGDCKQCEQLAETLSEKIVSLRTLMASELAVGPDDNVSSIISELPNHFFMNDEAREATFVRWPSGGGAVIYDINVKPPAQNLLNAISDHYSTLAWHTLRYDIYDPLELGGQWRKGCDTTLFWTQSWVNQNNEVINVSLYSYEQLKISVVITNSPSLDSQRSLDYYHKIHGSSDTDPSREIIDRTLRDGYRLIPLRQAY